MALSEASNTPRRPRLRNRQCSRPNGRGWHLEDGQSVPAPGGCAAKPVTGHLPGPRWQSRGLESVSHRQGQSRSREQAGDLERSRGPASGQHRLPTLSETPHADGERSFWSTGPGRHLCTRDVVAALHAKGFVALLPPESEQFLLSSPGVISVCAEIVVVFEQEVLQVKTGNDKVLSHFEPTS